MLYKPQGWHREGEAAPRRPTAVPPVAPPDAPSPLCLLPW